MKPKDVATAAKFATKYGPMAVKYGPLAVAAWQNGKEPVKSVARQQVAVRNAKRVALQHAEHVTDGSVIPTFDGDTMVWVVYSGEQAIACHPAVKVALEDLTRHVDLAKRIRPGSQPGRTPRRPRWLRRQQTLPE